VSAPNAAETTRAWELEWQQRIHEQLVTGSDLAALAQLPEAIARQRLGTLCHAIMERLAVPLSLLARQRVITQIGDEILGLGPLQPLLADSTISDILVNGHHTIYVERHGQLQLTDIRFSDDDHLRNIIDRIVSGVGRRIDESVPMVDARLADGSRVNAIIPPLAIDGPSLAIRRFGSEALTHDQLIASGSHSPVMAALLQGVVRGRLNLLIAGGTGSGKTTLLNALSAAIPTGERILTIEDAAELRLQQPHVVRLETRPANMEGRGAVTQRDLVRNALRMRPDRIIVGEVRGSEALDMLQAMNTGHDGSITTIHANTPRDALGRIEQMVAMTGLDLPIRTVRAQIAAAIHLVIQVERLADGRRCITSIQELQGMEGEIVTMAELFQLRRRGVDAAGQIRAEFVATGIVPQFQQRLQERGIALPLALYQPDTAEPLPPLPARCDDDR